jgi:hypothetical protein
LAEIGRSTRAYEPTTSLELIETLFTQSEQIESDDWTFTALRNHEKADEYPGTATDAYVIEAPATEEIETPEAESETAQAELRNPGTAVVTFSPPVADDFPSIRLLLPGDPLFDALVSIASKNEGKNVSLVCGRGTDTGTQVTLCRDTDETTEASVVAPAATEDGLTDLPSGSSLEDVTRTKERVREWLSRY